MPYLLKKAKLAVLPFLLALVAGILIPTAAYSTYQGVLLIGTMVISVFAVIQLNKIRRN